MLTKRENLLETIHGGKPDRFVNQYEYLSFVFDPLFLASGGPQRGQEFVKNNWGVTASWKEEWPGQMPVHHPESYIVIKDMEDWQEYVKAPSVEMPEAAWEEAIKQAESIDRKDTFVTAIQIPGIFEQAHHLGEIKNVLMAFYECPDELKDLFKYIGDYEIRRGEQLVKHLHPDALFHHDDWGSQISTFMSPEMFEEFLLPVYKDVYGWWKDNGVELIVHHSDSYGATLVPFMIDMGIDIWQGAMNSNNIPELIKKYGGQISIMGGIDSATVDYEGWTREVVAQRVKEACDACGPLYFIPGASQGLPISNFPGVYDCMTEEIDKYSKVYWAEHNL
jgi:hypothetical protein